MFSGPTMPEFSTHVHMNTLKNTHKGPRLGYRSLGWNLGVRKPLQSETVEHCRESTCFIKEVEKSDMSCPLHASDSWGWLTHNELTRHYNLQELSQWLINKEKRAEGDRK